MTSDPSLRLSLFFALSLYFFYIVFIHGLSPRPSIYPSIQFVKLWLYSFFLSMKKPKKKKKKTKSIKRKKKRNEGMKITDETGEELAEVKLPKVQNGAIVKMTGSSALARAVERRRKAPLVDQLLLESRIAREREDAKVIMKNLAANMDEEKEREPWMHNISLYAAAELKCKLAGRGFINTPGHVCDMRCTLKQERAVAYRRELVSRSEGAINRETRRGVTGGADYHICFPEHCPHVRSHVCNLREACPHLTRYSEANTKELTQLWVCQRTGTVHVCGKYCAEKKIETRKEGEMVCPLTGVVILSTYGETGVPRDKYISYTAPMAIESVEHAEMLVPTRMKLVSNGMRPWERHEDMLQYRALVNILCDELLFSERRQLMELVAIQAAWTRMMGEASKHLRQRKWASSSPEACGDDRSRRRGGVIIGGVAKPAGPPPKLAPIPVHTTAAIVRSLYPSNVYFAAVPVHPKVVPEIHSLVANTPGMTTETIIPHAPPDAFETCPHCDYAEAREAYERIMARVVAHKTPRPRLTWESERWQHFMKVTKKTIADVAIRVWRNLVEFDPRASPGRESTLQFAHVALAVMYLMQTEYSIPVRARVYDGAAPSLAVPRVVVIPRVPITVLLPPEPTLSSFTLPPYCHNAVKTMTTTQCNIKNQFAAIVAAGRAIDIQLRLSDLYKKDDRGPSGGGS